MGLLSNEKHRHKLVKLLLDHHKKLSVFSYLSGLIWFLALAYQPLNAGTYFSENALLPGLVESELTHTLSTKAHQLRDELRTELNKDKRVSPHNWVFEKFRALGLDTYQQNFSVVYPFKSLSQKVVTGNNVFAILRARRTASTEALVLSIPLRPFGAKEKPQTSGGIVLAVALAEQFKQKSHWAKDIIFLFTEHDEIGAQAWLDAYHESTSEYILTSPLEGRSGPIQAALNLELPLEKASYYNLRLEGLNGQLPNLDLVNLVVKLCRKERSQVMLHHSKESSPRGFYSENRGESLEEYLVALRTMFRMMWFQASGAPSGNHGLFHRFHIEALTLQGIKEKGVKGSLDLTTTARIIEGTFRSLNNLLERFHQSFFFYILPSTSRYVSIGMYMPPFGLMAAPGLIVGLAMWLTSGEEDTDSKVEESESERDNTDSKPDNEDDDIAMIKKSVKDDNAEKVVKDDDSLFDIKKQEDKEVLGSKGDDLDDTEGKEVREELLKLLKDEGEEDEEDVALSDKGLLTVVPVLMISCLLGWLAYQGPELLTRIMPKFRLQVEDMVLYSMLAIYTAALMYPKLMTSFAEYLSTKIGGLRGKTNPPQKFTMDWRLLKALGLIGQSLVLSCIALTNISQAFFLTAAMVPVTAAVRPCTNRLMKWVQLLALVLVSPLALMMMVGVASAWPQDDFLTLAMTSLAHMRELIFLSVMDTYLFNAWTQSIITAVVFPVWLTFWALPWVDA